MKTIEQLKVYLKFLLLNRRNTIIMFIGLGISLALIAEGMMFMYSFQYGGFTGFYREPPVRQFSIGISALDVEDIFDGKVSELDELVETAVKEVQLEDRVRQIDWFIGRSFFMATDNLITGNRTIIPNFQVFGIPPDYISALNSILYNGSLPQKNKEIIVVASKNVIDAHNISFLGSIPIYTPVIDIPPPTYEEIIEMGKPAFGIDLNITGVITSEVFTNPTGAIKEQIQTLNEYLGDYCILTSYTSFATITSEVLYFSGVNSPIASLTFDLDVIDSFKINEEIAQLTSLAQELTREFEKADYDVHVYADLTLYLEDFRKEFIIIQLFGLLFITPIIGMSLSLTSYSANLMKRRQKRQVSNMLQRGSSRKEVLGLLVTQVLELTVTAILIAVVLGYLFSWLMTRSVGFLNFTGVVRNPSLNMIIFYIIITAGFVLAIAINALNIWKMSSISTQEAYSETQEQKAIWEKLYLDVLLILIGIGLWLIVNFQIQEKSTESAYSFIYGIGTSAPVCLILGGILLAARLYPILINFISNISWKTKGLEIFGLATKRSSRRRSDTIRSLILITLSFTLIFSSLITINSYQDFDEETAYYTLGADILITSYDMNEESKDLILAIEGVHSATYITTTTQITTFGNAVYSYIVLGINATEFAETAYFDSEYIKGDDPVEHFSELDAIDEVFMQSKQLEQIGGELGHELTIYYERYPYGKQNRTVDVIGTYEYLPRYYTKEPNLDSSVYRFNLIGTYDNVRNFAYASYSISSDLIVKVEDGYTIKDVATEIEGKIKRGVQNVDDLTETFEGSLRNTMLYGSVNSSFISSVVITVSAIIMMIVVQSIENEREVVTLKILGMSPKQLFSMFLSEAASLVIFGSIMGAGLGIASAYMFSEIMTFETKIPANELSFPGFELGLAFVILFLSAIAAAAATARLIFRKDTIKAIKQI